MTVKFVSDVLSDFDHFQINKTSFENLNIPT